MVREANDYDKNTRNEADEYSAKTRNDADNYSSVTRSEADEYSAKTRSDADAYETQVKKAAEDYSAKTHSDADNYARQVKDKLYADSKVIEGNIESLKQFEADYRSRLTDFLGNLSAQISSTDNYPADREKTAEGNNSSMGRTSKDGHTGV